MSEAGPVDVKWGVGNAISTSSAVLFGHFVVFVGTALAASLPSLAFNILVPDTSYLHSIVDLIVGQIVSATLVYGSMQALRGRRVTIGECLSHGLQRLGAVLGVALLSGIGIVIGLALLVVPGMILGTMWAVAIPAAVIEERSATQSLSRSQELTSGSRWRVFFSYLVSLLILIVGGSVVAGVVEEITGEASTASVVVLWAFAALVQAFTACLVTTLYYFLRREREGIDINEIAAVFD